MKENINMDVDCFEFCDLIHSRVRKIEDYAKSVINGNIKDNIHIRADAERYKELRRYAIKIRFDSGELNNLDYRVQRALEKTLEILFKRMEEAA